MTGDLNFDTLYTKYFEFPLSGKYDVIVDNKGTEVLRWENDDDLDNSRKEDFIDAINNTTFPQLYRFEYKDGNIYTTLYGQYIPLWSVRGLLFLRSRGLDIVDATSVMDSFGEEVVRRLNRGK